MATYVGLDLSLTSTGFSCDTQRLVIATKAKGPQRLHEISTQLAELLIELDEPAVAIEGYSFASRNSQAHAIGELGGVIRLTLWNLHIPYIEIPPTCRAKFATGKGNASKGEVLSAVSARTGLIWSGAGADDLCDAFILEEMALAKCSSPRFNWPISHLDALNKVNWEPFSHLIPN